MARRHAAGGIHIVGFLLLMLLAATSAYAADMACTDCHNPDGIPIPHDSGCRNTTCAQNCHAKDLTRLRHPAGSASPLVGDRTTVCNSCHNRPFPGVYHPYKVNVSAGSSTNPGVVDLDQACGQCHGGGDNGVSNPPPEPSAPYMTKTELAAFAQGIHDDKPVARFGYSLATPNTLTVNVNASGSACFNVCDEYDWDWGDGTPHGSGVAASHTYAPGTYSIILTVTDTGVGTGTFSQQIAVVAPDYPPTVAGTCTFDADTWTETIVDASTDDRALGRVTVTWGDGSVTSIDTTPPFGPFTHIYRSVAPATPGYTITHKALDSAGQASARTCTAAPAYFAISGVVKSRTGSNLPSATITVRKGGTVVRTVYTATNGTFVAGSMKPGTYTLTVTKSGYTFAVPAATVTIGPSSSGNLINATAP